MKNKDLTDFDKITLFQKSEVKSYAPERLTIPNSRSAPTVIPFITSQLRVNNYPKCTLLLLRIFCVYVWWSIDENLSKQMPYSLSTWLQCGCAIVIHYNFKWFIEYEKVNQVMNKALNLLEKKSILKSIDLYTHKHTYTHTQTHIGQQRRVIIVFL